MATFLNTFPIHLRKVKTIFEPSEVRGLTHDQHDSGNSPARPPRERDPHTTVGESLKVHIRTHKWHASKRTKRKS